jgi:hypothetical protein
VETQIKLAPIANSPIKREQKMMPSVNRPVMDCQEHISPDHAVWGGIRHTTIPSVAACGLRLMALALFVACGLAMAGSKISGDRPV